MMNAHLVMLILVNTALLFGSIEIFARHFPGPLFRPLALAAAVLVIYNVNLSHPASALVSSWMPHVALFPFLFFALACASVAAGRVGHLPLLALGAMTVVHLHVAQILFAGVLSLAACLAALVWALRAPAGRRVFRQHAPAFALSVGIVALFLMPMVLELVLHKPNNLDYARAYLQLYPDPHQGIAVASRYLLSFLTFSPDAVARVYAPASELLAQAAHTPHVAIYWALFAAGLGASVAMAVRHPKLLSRFTRVAVAEGVVIVALFLYWADRITGGMYQFNGFFVYSLHLLGLFLIAGTMSAWLASRRPHWGRWARLVWAIPFLSMVAVAGEFRNPDTGTPAIRKMSDEMRSPGVYELLFQHDDWPTAVGVANQFVRRGQAVITGTAWFELGRQPLKLPVVIGPDELSARTEGFYATEHSHEGNYCWSGRTGSLFFSLDGDDGAAEYRVTVTGSVLPYRPVEVSINGHRLGVMDGIWKSSISFLTGRDTLRFGDINQIKFHTADSGPTAVDARDVGFSLISVRIEGVGRQ